MRRLLCFDQRGSDVDSPRRRVSGCASVAAEPGEGWGNDIRGRIRWRARDVGESGSPFAQCLQAAGRVGILLGVGCWGCCPPPGHDMVRGPMWDIHPHNLPLSGWKFAHDIRVLPIAPLEALFLRFGLFTAHRRSIPQLGRLP
jgi:hypothetical protein